MKSTCRNHYRPGRLTLPSSAVSPEAHQKAVRKNALEAAKHAAFVLNGVLPHELRPAAFMGHCTNSLDLPL